MLIDLSRSIPKGFILDVVSDSVAGLSWPFFVDGADRGESRAEYDRLSIHVTTATRRLRDLEIGVGDVVLFQAGQGPEALIMFWAAIARGAIFAPLDDSWPNYLVRQAAGSLSPKIVVCSGARRRLYEDLFPGVPQINLKDAGSDEERAELPPLETWDGWLGAAVSQAVETIPRQGSMPAAYLFTSGSTGVPKAVVLSRAALAHGAALTLRTFEWAPGERLVNLPEPNTMSGLRNGLVAAPLGGLTCIPVGPSQRANIFALLEAIEEARPDRLVAGPALIRQLAQLGDRVDRSVLASVKAIYCTGAMLSPVAADRFHAQFGTPIINYYGLTETGGICVSQRIQGWTAGDRSIGTAAGARLRVVTEGGAYKAIGIGELQVRSPQLMSEYLDDPERTLARFDGPWLRTGDLARIAPDGRVYLIGRSDGFIKTASTDRVAPEEIEMVLEEHPAVAEAAVLGVTTEHDYERIAALIVLREGRSAPTTDLADFVAVRLGPARTPSQIQIVDRLPRQEIGKIARSELRGLLNGNG